MVSAVILSYNRCKEVLITVSKLKALQPSFLFPLQIIVVDNASIDDTSTQIQILHPDVTLVTKKSNNGIAGWNDGFAVATEKYILVLDDDSCIVTGLPEAVSHLEINAGFGILAFQIIDTAGKMNVGLDPEEAWKDDEDIPGFIGCGAMFRRKLYEKIGGYADWIYLYTHEFEYALRCLNAGYQVKFFSKALVEHRVSKVNRSNKRMRVFTTRNELAIVYKYFSGRRMKFLTRVFLNNLKIVKKEGLISAYYVLLGAIEFLKLTPRLSHTPVMASVQEFYAMNFWSTKSLFYNFRKRLR